MAAILDMYDTELNNAVWEEGIHLSKTDGVKSEPIKESLEKLRIMLTNSLVKSKTPTFTFIPSGTSVEDVIKAIDTVIVLGGMYADLRDVTNHSNIFSGTVFEILDNINRDHSKDFSQYTPMDWVDGVDNFTEFEVVDCVLMDIPCNHVAVLMQNGDFNLSEVESFGNPANAEDYFKKLVRDRFFLKSTLSSEKRSNLESVVNEALENGYHDFNGTRVVLEKGTIRNILDNNANYMGQYCESDINMQ